MATQPWQNRIVGYGEEAPDQLLANPRNFRIHPKNQQDALAGVLGEVGYVQNVIVNQTTGHLIDGHLRVSLALRDRQPSIPVTYVALSEAEEALVLATLDPLAAMAATDAAQLKALLDEVATGDAAVMAMLSELAEREGVVPPSDFDPNAEWQGMPEFVQEDQTAVFQCHVNFTRMEDVAAFEELVGQRIPRDRKSIWYPEIPRRHNPDQWVGETDAS